MFFVTGVHDYYVVRRVREGSQKAWMDENGVAVYLETFSNVSDALWDAVRQSAITQEGLEIDAVFATELDAIHKEQNEKEE